GRPMAGIGGLSARALAAALGGEATGNRILAPGPGHSREDRSMSVDLTPETADGFVVNSFAGDDFKACRDHVLAAAGMTWKPNGHRVADTVDRGTPSHPKFGAAHK